MQTSPNAAFDVVERRIQTLTSILQNMNRRHSPTSDRSQVPGFLRHLATLLTCDRKDDPGGERVIAVTGSLTNADLGRDPKSIWPQQRFRIWSERDYEVKWDI